MKSRFGPNPTIWLRLNITFKIFLSYFFYFHETLNQCFELFISSQLLARFFIYTLRSRKKSFCVARSPPTLELSGHIFLVLKFFLLLSDQTLNPASPILSGRPTKIRTFLRLPYYNG